MYKYKILLVEDELNLRETITELLIYQNYNVKTANNGQEALEILNNWIPDLIISDIMMPIMDGHMLHETIRNKPHLSIIPFIFLTAKKGEDEMRKCMLNGVDDFLVKPFKFDVLKKTIDIRIEKFKKIKTVYDNYGIGKDNYSLHEINTPLFGILGSIDQLIENGDNLDKYEIALFHNAIKSSGERLNRTVQNLILYEKLQNNRLEFLDNFCPDISEIFLNINYEIQKLYKNEVINICFDFEKAYLKISCDHLKIILFELIDNAVKFSKDSKLISVTGKQNQNEYEIEIKDSGIGFSPEELNNIDARKQFNRGKKEQQGLGLGLFISKTIIQKSKGVFNIISKENEGTTIKINLPSHKGNR
jgi:two-component system sensor histidine kinase/response regulator